MRNGVSRPVFVLSTMIAILAGVASAGGIFVSGLYRDNVFVNSTWLGSDLVTLFVAVPLLVVALLLATRGSDRAYLVLLGVVDSILYSYGFYLFGTAFNPFFMIYAAVVSLSIWALIYGLTNLDADQAQSQVCAEDTCQDNQRLHAVCGGGPGLSLYRTMARVPDERAGAGHRHEDGAPDQRRLRVGSDARDPGLHCGRTLAMATQAVGLRGGGDHERQGRRVHAWTERLYADRVSSWHGGESCRNRSLGIDWGRLSCRSGHPACLLEKRAQQQSEPKLTATTFEECQR